MSSRSPRMRQTAKGQGKLKIGFVLARQFTLSAFALFVDTLRLASDEFDKSGRVRADWQVLGSTRHLIPSSCGVQLAPTSDFLPPEEFDYIVVVGGLLSVEHPIDDDTVRYLRQAAARGVPLIGLCTGTFILADAGLMKDHRACVSWLHFEAYKQREGTALDDFATWCALAEKYGADWRTWPAALHHPASPEVAEFAGRRRRTVRIFTTALDQHGVVHRPGGGRIVVQGAAGR